MNAKELTVCKLWFIETGLEEAKVPDSAGYVTKKICKKCLKEIEERSSRLVHQEKPKKLLMETES